MRLDITKLLLLVDLTIAGHFNSIRNQTHVTLKGDRLMHTQDKDGNFHHPFVNQPDHVTSIHFEDSKTVSVKIEQKPGPHLTGSEPLPEVSWADSIKEILTGVSVNRRIPLIPYFNLKYVGPIYMGSNQEQINVIYDTGSSVYLAETHMCTSCTAPTYNFADE